MHSEERANLRRYEHFEELVARVFERNGLGVERRIAVQRGRGSVAEVDMLLTAGDVRSVVEVKLYRSRTPAPGQLATAFKIAKRAQYAFAADNAIVVTNGRRDNLPISHASDAGVILLGLEDLLVLAAAFPDVEAELIETDRELSSSLGSFDAGVTIPTAGASAILDALKQLGYPGVAQRPNNGEAPQEHESGAAPEGRGAKLATELRSIPPGRDGGVTTSAGRTGVSWRLFELVCYDAVKYVFEDHLHSWRDQENVGGDASRFDVIAKVKGTDVFSRMLIEHFDSRYILFEFKNYQEPLKSNLIHVTEKYLYPRALRATAIFVSPKGLTPEAAQAAQGALRETGKLMLSLDVEALCLMLMEKDQATAPDVRLEALLDGFLQALGR